jgi:protein disulfide-isomerase
MMKFSTTLSLRLALAASLCVAAPGLALAQPANAPAAGNAPPAAGQSAAAPAPPSGKWIAYDENADARAEVQKALAVARAQGRKVLVVFGANWCPDCIVLDQSMKQGSLKPLMARDFVVVKVDVGRFKKNLDLAEQYGVPLKKGIPSLAVLDAQGRVIYATREGEIGDARTMGEDGLVKFFDRRW